MKRFPILGIALLGFVTALGANAPAGHVYRLDLHGTAGVRLRMLLITKAAGGPERREEIVTLPAKIDFRADSCYAWFDTLPNGASGNNGDVCDVDLLRDGHKVSACEGSITKANRRTQGLGDL